MRGSLCPPLVLLLVVFSMSVSCAARKGGAPYGQKTRVIARESESIPARTDNVWSRRAEDVPTPAAKIVLDDGTKVPWEDLPDFAHLAERELSNGLACFLDTVIGGALRYMVKPIVKEGKILAASGDTLEALWGILDNHEADESLYNILGAGSYFELHSGDYMLLCGIRIDSGFVCLSTESFEHGAFSYSTMEPPAPRRLYQPEYPEIAQSNGIEGKVVAWLYIDEQGSIIRVEIIESPSDVLVKPTEAAMLRSSFYPATKNGVPVKARVTQSFEFFLHR